MRFFRFGIIAGFMFLSVLHAQSEAPDLFFEGPAEKSASSPVAALQSTLTGLVPVRSRLVRLNLDAIDPDSPAALTGRKLRLNLFPGLDPEVAEIRSRRGADRGKFQWIGSPAADSSSDVVLSVVDGRVSGSLSLPEGFFQIRHVEGDVHEITEVLFDRSQAPDDAVPPPAGLPTLQAQAKALSGPDAVAAAGDPVVDVLIVYTPEARAKVGGSQAIQDRIALAIAEANASFVNSAAAIEFRLVGMAEVPISGVQSPTSSFLTQVTTAEANIQSLRNYYGADLVSVWVSDTNGGVIGIGWLNPGPPTDFSGYPYAVVSVSYSNGPYYTFAHEGGHNLGGAHDRAHASNAGAFSYSYGYRYDPNPGGGFYTIMAYSSGCGGCSPTNRWSNPNLLIDGVPSGVPQNQADSADNAATLSQIAPSAATFRATKSVPANSSPVASDQTRTVLSSQAAAITLGATDPNGDTIYFDIISEPPHGDLAGSGASWTYTGDLGYSGSDSFQFQARDSYGGWDIGSVSLNVQLPSTTPPNVSLAAPTGGPFTAPASINLVATASDADGIDHVAFYANGSLIGSVTSATSTFTLQWTNVQAGSYSVTAIAHDNLGATKTSNAVTVNVATGGGGAAYTTRLGRLFYSFDEGTGNTVYDHIGSNNGTKGGSSAWTGLGLQGGWVNSGVSSFSANKLSPKSGDAFTVVWVGKLGAGNVYQQTLFSMADAGAANVQLRYNYSNGYLYLTLNNNVSNAFNAGSLYNKNVMAVVRCSGGACTWRIGDAGSWINGNVGSAVASAPLLQVGSDYYHWTPFVGSASALFWVYGDALTDAEVDANFNYAGATLAARGFSLDGYSGSTSNSSPVAQDQAVTTPYQTSRAITLSATDADGDSLTYSVLSGPSHGSLSGTAPALTYTPASGYSGADAITFQVSDGKGGSDTGIISITVGAGANASPAVSLAAPAGGPFTAPASINLVATATDSDGSVDHVQFFANGASIGSATSANSTFTFAWTNVAAGTHTVYARAVDNLGATTNSSTRSVTVAASSTGSGYTTRTSRLFYQFDEGSGSTVYDKIGSNDGTKGGSSTWTALGLQGGWVNSGASSFNGNKLSPKSGDAFTLVWVGKLGAGNVYQQTLFSMADGSASNVQLRYNQSNGYIYLLLNNNGANAFYAGALADKNVMAVVRCAGGACTWRVGGSGSWRTGNVGNSVAAAPLLQVGSDYNHWTPLVGSASALFWVYGDKLTDAEIDTNFQYAGDTLAGRGLALDGYSSSSSGSNAAPVATDQNLTTPYQTPLGITLSATDANLDPLSYSVSSTPSHGTLTGTAPNLTYTPASGYSGADSFSFQANDGNGGVGTGLISITVGSAPGGYTTRTSRLFYQFDEGSGSTVYDQVGSNHGTKGGSSSWTALGLQGGWVDSGASSFSGNKLSPKSGDAFTVVWVGKLGAGGVYQQTLFSMAGSSIANIQLRYNYTNGYLYLTLNNNVSNAFNAAALAGKNVMAVVRCSGGACTWRVGGSGSWITGYVGSSIAAAPLLQIGSDYYHWTPFVESASALFWVYGDILTDAEIDTNFQYAGSILAARGFALDGYGSSSADVSALRSRVAAARER